MIRNFCEQLLVFQLDLVRYDITDCGGPICSQRVVARDPLGADVGVDLNGMRPSIVTLGSQREVSERQRLSDEIVGLIRRTLVSASNDEKIID